jgi:hypothetical protein
LWRRWHRDEALQGSDEAREEVFGVVEVGAALWQHVRRSPATDGEGS